MLYEVITAIVETKYGKVRGYRRNGIYTYKGLPYGDSTSGKNRFMAPKEPEPWTGVRNALYWGNAAPAEAGLGYPIEPSFDHFDNSFTYNWGHKRFGEDCLSVNVWTPEIRITSYNVCYTKLLRGMEPGPKSASSESRCKPLAATS